MELPLAFHFYHMKSALIYLHMMLFAHKIRFSYLKSSQSVLQPIPPDFKHNA